MKKRLRRVPTRSRLKPQHSAGSYSLMKKRLRLSVKLTVAAVYDRRKLFADEEAIETLPRECTTAPVGHAGSYSLMKKRLRRYVGNHRVHIVLNAGSYSLMKKRLRLPYLRYVLFCV